VELSELVVAIFRVNGLALAAGDQMTRPVGLSSARWQVLGVIDHGAAPVAKIARTMGLARQSVQQTVDGLAREGLVEAIPNPDHRTAKLIAPTAGGLALLRKVEARHAVWARRIAARLDGGGVRAALGALRELEQVLDADIHAHAPRRENKP
jgi:DNA-binding MarR family transcriptional regulator